MIGWVILAVSAYRSRTLGLLRSIALGLMVMVPIGTLKGTDIRTLAGTAGLLIALVPLGVSILRESPPLSRRARFWILVFVAWHVIHAYLSIKFPMIMN